MAIPKGFRGAAKRLDDIDLPHVGSVIGVGEDEIHAVLDVESRGSGFDGKGRPAMLFEPHIFYRQLGPGKKRDKAVSLRLAYEKWRRDYPSDSYQRLVEAMEIDETAALKSASWGMGQILGTNHKAAGYATIQAMVEAMCHDEENHLSAMIRFIRFNGLDRPLRAHDWAKFARGYNGPAYAANRYDIRLAAAYAKWLGIKDTPWRRIDAVQESQTHDAIMAQVRDTVDAPAVAPKPQPAPTPATNPALPQPASPAPPAPGFWSRLLGGLFK